MTNESVHFKLTWNGETRRFVFVVDHVLEPSVVRDKVAELFETLSADNILVWKDGSNLRPLETHFDLSCAVNAAFLNAETEHFSRTKPACVYLEVADAPLAAVDDVVATEAAEVQPAAAAPGDVVVTHHDLNELSSDDEDDASSTCSTAISIGSVGEVMKGVELIQLCPENKEEEPAPPAVGLRQKHPLQAIQEQNFYAFHNFLLRSAKGSSPLYANDVTIAAKPVQTQPAAEQQTWNGQHPTLARSEPANDREIISPRFPIAAKHGYGYSMDENATKQNQPPQQPIGTARPKIASLEEMFAHKKFQYPTIFEVEPRPQQLTNQHPIQQQYQASAYEQYPQQMAYPQQTAGWTEYQQKMADYQRQQAAYQQHPLQMAQHQARWTEYQQKMADYQQKVAEYHRQQAAYQQNMQQYQAYPQPATYQHQSAHLQQQQLLQAQYKLAACEQQLHQQQADHQQQLQQQQESHQHQLDAMQQQLAEYERANQSLYAELNDAVEQQLCNPPPCAKCTANGPLSNLNLREIVAAEIERLKTVMARLMERMEAVERKLTEKMEEDEESDDDDGNVSEYYFDYN